MLSATTLTQDDDTALSPMDMIGTAANLGGQVLGTQGGTLGAIGQVASGVGQALGGGGGAPTGGIGSSIGGIAGGALGTLLGPAGTALGGVAGSAIGSAIEGLFGSHDDPVKTQQDLARLLDLNKRVNQMVSSSSRPGLSAPSRPREVAAMTSSERAVWDRAVDLSKRLNSRAPREDAWLRIWNPTQYEAQRREGRTPMQLFEKARAEAARTERERKLASRERAEHELLFQGLSGFQKIRLENALKKGEGALVYRQIQSEIAAEQAKKSAVEPSRAAPPPPAPAAPIPIAAPPPSSAVPVASRVDDEQESKVTLSEEAERVLRAISSTSPSTRLVDEASAPLDDETSGYFEEEASGPSTAPDDSRPRPARHISLIPLQEHQLAEMIRRVPVLQKLDVRSLQLLSGRSSVARDVSGVDPATRTYQAEPGETATGIAKQLTGNAERAVELLASNPGKDGRDPTWRIPPGWLVFDRADTGAITTQRKYVVANGDFPMKIADRLGAKGSHPQWWRELKDANPDKPTVDGGSNWKGLFAGEELGVPDSWPLSPLAVPNTPNGLLPNLPSVIPGAPSLQLPMPTPGVSPIPGLPNMPGFPSANATQDAGVQLQAQGMLAYFAATHPGIISPPDFGRQAADFTGTQTPRGMQATQSFQLWWDAGNPMNAVRVDGVLDDATYKALYTATAGQIPRPMPGIPSSPSSPQQPQPQIPIPNGDILPAVLPSGPPIPVITPPAVPQLQPMPSTGPATPIPGFNQPQGTPGTQVPGLPPGWTWTVPDSPFGTPWQAPAPPATPPPQKTADDSSSSSGGGLALAGLAAAALALL